MATPLLDYDTLDVDGLRRLVEHLIAGGVHGIFVLGSTGEYASLSFRLRRELITQSCEIAAGRVPIVVGISDTAMAHSIDLALVAADAGASTLVLSAPYYIPPTAEELTSYFERIVSELPLPLLLYDIPKFTQSCFEMESLRRLCDQESIVGIKDSGGDLEQFRRLLELLELRPDWSFLVGPEHLLLEVLKLGGDGGIPGGANLAPSLFVECYEAFRAGDQQKATALHADILKLRALYGLDDSPAAFINGIKCDPPW